MIRVVQDDLATLRVDAVVRPANANLEPVTPLAFRLDEHAGPEFSRLRRVQAPLDVGAAVVTGAGALPAEFVLHVVIQSEERSIARETVRRALVSAWQRAGDWRLASVAVPLVGMGSGGISLEESAALLVQTFRDRSGVADFPTELKIVVERSEEVSLVEAIVGRPE